MSHCRWIPKLTLGRRRTVALQALGESGTLVEYLPAVMANPNRKDAPARTLLHQVLRSESVNLEDVENLLDEEVQESTLLDYKRGSWLKNDRCAPELGRPNRADAKLRKAVAGFANGEGGLLIVGAANDEPRMPNGDPPDDAWQVSGCRSPEATPLDRWVSKALEPLRGAIRWNPLVIKLENPGKHGGEVLLVGVGRSEHLVYCSEMHVPVLYLRFHDSTLRMPEYLAHDLIVGRRQRAELEVRGEAAWQRGEDGLFLQLEFTVDNASLAWAEDLHLGLVGLTRERSGILKPAANVMDQVQVGSREDLPTGLDVHALRSLLEDPALAPHKVGLFPSASLQPFDRVKGRLTIPVVELDPHMRWLGGLYVVSRNDLPRWWQVDVVPCRPPSVPQIYVRRLDLEQRPLVFCGRTEYLSPEHQALLAVVEDE